MIIKNHMGLDVSVDDAKMTHIVKRYGSDLELIYKCDSRRKLYKKLSVLAMFVAGVCFANSKAYKRLGYEFTKDLYRDIQNDEIASEVFNELLK